MDDDLRFGLDSLHAAVHLAELRVDDFLDAHRAEFEGREAELGCLIRTVRRLREYKGATERVMSLGKDPN